MSSGHPIWRGKNQYGTRQNLLSESWRILWKVAFCSACVWYFGSLSVSCQTCCRHVVSEMRELRMYEHPSKRVNAKTHLNQQQHLRTVQHCLLGWSIFSIWTHTKPHEQYMYVTSLYFLSTHIWVVFFKQWRPAVKKTKKLHYIFVTCSYQWTWSWVQPVGK